MPARLINGHAAISFNDVRRGLAAYRFRDGWFRMVEMGVLETALVSIELLHLLFSSPGL